MYFATGFPYGKDEFLSFTGSCWAVMGLLSALPDPPRIVFLTVHEGADFLAAAREAGASGYVVKRNAGRDLIHALKQTLSGHRAFPELNYEGSPASD